MPASVRHRQSYFENRSPRLARELDEPAVTAHEVLRDREAEARARRPSGDERIENRLLELVRDTGAVIFDLGLEHQAVTLASHRVIAQRARSEDEPAALP